MVFFFFFFQAEDGIRDGHVTGVQTCALPICGFVMVRESRPATMSANPAATTPATMSEGNRMRSASAKAARGRATTMIDGFVPVAAGRNTDCTNSHGSPLSMNDPKFPELGVGTAWFVITLSLSTST